MSIRLQILEEQIENTASSLKITRDKAFLVFAHSLLIDESIHSFNKNDDVDGGQDKQLDAITIEDGGDEATVYISQVKTESSFSSNTVVLLHNGLSWVFEKSNADIGTLSNKNFKDRINDFRAIRSKLGPSNIHIKVFYIAKAETSNLAAEVLQEIKAIKNEYDNNTFASFSFSVLGIDEIIDCLNVKEKANRKIDENIKIAYDVNKPSLIKFNGKGMRAVICTAPASEIARIVNKDIGGYIFDMNIRKYLGNRGSVNQEIISTCVDVDRSNLFWFLNNGITIVCDKLDIVDDPDDAHVKLKNIQIVNGCQTSSSLAIAAKNGNLQSDTKVMLRIYETEASNLDLIANIVQSTNNQNKISGRDLKANAEEQKDLEKAFLLYGYHLERKPRQYHGNISVTANTIVPNEDVGKAYLGIVLKRSADARVRKYKVWNEYYDRVFKKGELVEAYLLSYLLYHQTNEEINLNFSNNSDDTKRYLAKNGSFHLARIVAFLLKKNDDWHDQSNLKKHINDVTNDLNIVKQLTVKAMQILHEIIVGNQKYLADLNGALKSNELDSEINKELYTKYK